MTEFAEGTSAASRYSRDTVDVDSHSRPGESNPKDAAQGALLVQCLVFGLVYENSSIRDFDFASCQLITKNHNSLLGFKFLEVFPIF